MLGAAPAPAAPHSATATPVPHIWPTPQQLRPGHGTQPVPEDVVEVIGHATDPAARALTERVLRDAGARTIRTVRAGRPTPPAALTVYLGGPTENPATARALRGRRGPAMDPGYPTSVSGPAPVSASRTTAVGSSHGAGRPC